MAAIERILKGNATRRDYRATARKLAKLNRPLLKEIARAIQGSPVYGTMPEIRQQVADLIELAA